MDANDEFTILVNKYGPKLVNVARYYTGNYDDGNDLFQNALIKGWKNFHRFDRTNFFGWMATIIRNDFITSTRKRKLYTIPITDENKNYVFGLVEDEQDDELISVEDLDRHIEGMKKNVRDALSLRVAGHTYQEIADILGVTMADVKSRIYRGKRALIKILVEE